jgi:hypothetical protein
VAAAVVSGGLLLACRAFDAEPDGVPTEAGDGTTALDSSVESPPDGGSDGAKDAARADGDPDATVRCDDDKAFGSPTELVDQGDVTSVRLTADGATAFVSSVVSGAAEEDIYEGPFPKLNALYAHVVETAEGDTHPAPVKDPLRLFFEHGATGARAVVIGVRDQAGQSFVISSTLLAVPSGAQTREPYALGDGSVVYFTMESATGRRIVRATSLGGAWTTEPIAGIVSGLGEGHAVVTDDELVIFFSRGTPADIMMARRAAKGAAFAAALPVEGAVNGASDDRPTWLSPDRCTLLFTSNRSGSYRAYSASRR